MALLGEMKKFEGNRNKQKLHQILVHFLGGHFYCKTGSKMRVLAKMSAADRSNAICIYIYINGNLKNCIHVFGDTLAKWVNVSQF